MTEETVSSIFHSHANWLIPI